MVVGSLGAALEMGAGVHAQATGTTTETITFGSVFASVAVLAEKLCLVFGAIGGV